MSFPTFLFEGLFSGAKTVRFRGECRSTAVMFPHLKLSTGIGGHRGWVAWIHLQSGYAQFGALQCFGLPPEKKTKTQYECINSKYHISATLKEKDIYIYIYVHAYSLHFNISNLEIASPFPLKEWQDCFSPPWRIGLSNTTIWDSALPNESPTNTETYDSHFSSIINNNNKI